MHIYFSGLGIYFFYGMHHSAENRPLAESGQTLMSYSTLKRDDELAYPDSNELFNDP